jgi:hypothetical protein
MAGMSVLRSNRGLKKVNVSGICKDTVLPRTLALLRKELTAAKKVPAKPRLVKRRQIDENENEVYLEGKVMEAKKTKLE